MRFKTSYITLVITAAFFMLMGGSCTKVRIQTVGGTLKFSVDTLKFDTVFTALGSFTTGLVIYNPQNEEVVVGSVKMNEGVGSYFHLNVDGWAVSGGASSPSIKIAAHDSAYVFATVTIDPNIKTTPFLVTDSLVVTMNGKNYYVPFTAYGQNAHYIVDSILAGTNIIWNDTLPYVIINSAEVNTGSTLTIQKGTQIYMHQNSALVVLGTLITQGTPQDTIVIKGDRPDPAYWGWLFYPGEWGGIYFGSYSTGSNLNYTRIENGGNGVLTGGIAAEIILYEDSTNFGANTNSYTGAFPSSATPQLTLNHCIVENSFGYGIYSFQGSLVASNCNINTTGQQALAIVQGGFDSITNCTFANYGNVNTGLSHSQYGTVAILDYYWDGTPGDPTYYGGLNAVLRNCIVYGSLDSEIQYDDTNTPLGTYTANLLLDNCLLNIGTAVPESFVTLTDCIYNKDPLFKDTANGDFHLTAGSPAIGAGTTNFIPANYMDLDGNTWGSGSIDIGCYHYTH